MLVRHDQLSKHLGQQGLRAIYTVFGDEPLLAQEAGDAIRQAGRAAGFSERQVFTVSGAYFDWGPVLGAAQEMSLFADKQLIEIRIPSGKPGKDGSDALQRYCERVPDEVLTLVTLPKLDRQQQASSWFSALDSRGAIVRVDPVDRAQLPQWLAQRLNVQHQRMQAGEAGTQALAFFADRVEGNLLAAHQELQKLALLYPPGELTFEQIEGAVLNVARYDVFKFGEAVLAGQTTRVLRMLAGLQAEGEAAVLVHWTLAEDIRALKRVRDGLDSGRPLPMALREGRVWGAKEKLFERLFAQQGGPVNETLVALVQGAQICDGIVKGLRHPQWPADPWAALQRLALMVVQANSTKRKPGSARLVS